MDVSDSIWVLKYTDDGNDKAHEIMNIKTGVSREKLELLKLKAEMLGIKDNYIEIPFGIFRRVIGNFVDIIISPNIRWKPMELERMASALDLEHDIYRTMVLRETDEFGNVTLYTDAKRVLHNLFEGVDLDFETGSFVHKGEWYLQDGNTIEAIENSKYHLYSIITPMVDNDKGFKSKRIQVLRKTSESMLKDSDIDSEINERKVRIANIENRDFCDYQNLETSMVFDCNKVETLEIRIGFYKTNGTLIARCDNLRHLTVENNNLYILGCGIVTDCKNLVKLTIHIDRNGFELNGFVLPEIGAKFVSKCPRLREIEFTYEKYRQLGKKGTRKLNNRKDEAERIKLKAANRIFSYLSKCGLDTIEKVTAFGIDRDDVKS